jgi:hypothetical protein
MPAIFVVNIVLALLGGPGGIPGLPQLTVPNPAAAPAEAPVQPVPFPPAPMPMPLQPPPDPRVVSGQQDSTRVDAIAPGPVRAQTPAQPPAAPSQAPSQPAQVPAKPSMSLRSAFLIEPGDGIGPFRIGMRIEYLEGRLGGNKGIQKFEDGSSVYRWFEPPTNAGIAARISDAGVVQRIWVLNDERYKTKEGLHIGNTEAQVRSTLGAPTEVEEDQQQKTRTLRYYGAGVWFIIQLDDRYTFYNAVYDIGVMPPR